MVRTSTFFSNIHKVSSGIWLRLLFFILAYAFLAYKLAIFSHYAEMAVQLKQTTLMQAGWLALVLLLLPVNWLLESIKWKMLLANLQLISLKNAVRAVLGGMVTGFFTPNRVGELVGRIAFLKNENRKAGATLSLLNSFTQNLMMAVGGIPACIAFFYVSKSQATGFNVALYVSIITICMISGILLFFRMPQMASTLKPGKISSFLSPYIACLSGYTRTELLNIMLVTLLRYAVFCMQFYFMLLFFGVNIAWWQALIAIPTTYLFVSFTPSLAFSEAAVRSSYAVLFIGAFSTYELPVILAGVSIWVVNFVVPMMAGSVVMLRKNKPQASPQTIKI